MQAILSLAHSLQMQVVAEGVEREEQLEILRDLSCDVIQGFLWGRPQPGRSIPGLIASGIAQPCMSELHAHAEESPEGHPEAIS